MSDCPFCKTPCNMPHCPYTKKENEECDNCEEKISQFEKERKYLIKTIKDLEELFKRIQK